MAKSARPLREENLLDGLLQGLFAHESGSDLGLILHGAEEQGGDALYPECGSQLGLFVDVDFIDVDLPGIFAGNLLEYGSLLPAGAAPRGIEIDDAGACTQILPAVGGFLKVGYSREKLGFGELAGFYFLYLSTLFLFGGLLLGLARKEERQAGNGYSQDVFRFHIDDNCRVMNLRRTTINPLIFGGMSRVPLVLLWLQRYEFAREYHHGTCYFSDY